MAKADCGSELNGSRHMDTLAKEKTHDNTTP